mgnify:CR=1 FL=1
MKQETLKNKIVFFTGILAGLFVLGLIIFSPGQNASAISVSDEVQRRVAEYEMLEDVGFAVEELLGAEEELQVKVEHNEGYVLSEVEKERYFAGELVETAAILTSAPTMTTTQADYQLVQETPDAVETLAESENESRESNVVSQQEITDTESHQSVETQENIEAIGSISTSEEKIDNPWTPFFAQDPVENGKLIVLRVVDPVELQKPTSIPTSSPPNTPVPSPTKLPTMVPTTESTPEPMPTPTEEPTPIEEPTLEPTSVPTDDPDVFWNAGFETGDISEWTSHGAWLRQGDTATYKVQSNTVHSGNYAVKLTIDTSSGRSQAAYLFYWDELPEAAYYSAWYYIPDNIDTEVWWNIMQWKSTYNGNTDYSRPIFVLDGALFGQTALSLCYLPDREADKRCWKQTEVDLPQNQWVHIEVYYQRDKQDGQVIVWQDGVQIFDVTGYPTVLSDGTLYYSVNHYTDGIAPDVSSIYIDDVMITFDRMWPHWE